jgi:ketosteroid isomerase-like protein
MSSATLDLDALRHALESRDADAVTALYDDDAELVSVRRDAPPGAPRIIRGREAIGVHFADVLGRDATHVVERAVGAPGTAAIVESCRYADGTEVLCMATFDTDTAGRIIRHLEVSAWGDTPRT